MSGNNNQQQIRRKFLQWGGMSSLALLAATGLRKLFFRQGFAIERSDIISCAPPSARTIKMLTQEGKLVEVDASLVKQGKKTMITEDQLKNWVAGSVNHSNKIGV